MKLEPQVALKMMEHIPSISGLLQIAAGAAIIGTAIGYAWWSSIRTTFFREDLFAIRDAMWDSARQLDCLEDPQYQYMRDVLNSCISAASFMSIPQMTHSMLVSASPRVAVKSSRHEVAEVVEQAEKQLVLRVTRYIILDRPVSGLFFGTLAVTVALSVFAPRMFFLNLIRKWTETDSPHKLSLLARTTDKAAHAT